jgi:hypothetical protein
MAIKLFLIMLSSLMLVNCQSLERTKDATVASSKTGRSVRSHSSVIQPNSPKSCTDIGSAILWREQQCILHQTAFDSGAKIADYYSGEKIPVREALSVWGSGITTPGGRDMIAFEDRKSAEKFMEERGRGEILTFDDILELTAE